jgi:flagellar hook-associated protein 2
MASKVSGSDGGVRVEGGTSQLSFTTLAGRDAVVNVDGIPYQSTTNSISGAIAGVTLNLSSAAPATEVTLNVSPDVTSVAAALNTFVSDYNAVLKSISSQFSYDASTGAAGVLSGDSSLRSVQQSLLSIASFSMSGNGKIDSLRAMGIEMQNDGSLTIDSSALNSALTSNFPDLTNFFQGAGSFGETLGATMTTLNSPSNGALALDLKSMQQTNQDLTNHINDFENRLLAQQQLLIVQYSQINAQLQSLPGLQNQLSAELDSLSGFYSSSSKK